MNSNRIEDLRSALRGPLLQPSDAGYDAARTIFNAAIDRKPALIARCAGVADVVRCVRFAREQALVVSVKGGGHNVAGLAIADGGLMIDLSPMKGIGVDPARRTVSAQAGVTWGEFDHETQAFGLATPGGAISTTGIAGLTLGGGLGWLTPKYGMTCDNLIEADVVLADGTLVTANARKNPDLFWALRGGGGNFGIVTRFVYRLHRVGTMLAGTLIHPLKQGRDFFRFYRDWSRELPDEITTMLGTLPTPDGQVAGVVVGACGSLRAAEKTLAPLRKFGSPLADLIEPTPYAQLQRALDEGFPAGWYHYWKSGFLRELSDAAIDTFLEQAAACPTPKTSMVYMEHLHGAPQRVAPDATAFAVRDQAFNFNIIATSPDAADAEPNTAWARKCWATMQAHVGTRTYLNYLGDEGNERVRDAYGENYQRLAEVKAKYDPDNFFRMNQNIRPAAAQAGA